jgi:hypothetical protein
MSTHLSRPLVVALACFALLSLALIAAEQGRAEPGSVKCSIATAELEDAEGFLAGEIRNSKKAQKKLKAANEAIRKATTSKAKQAAKKKRDAAKEELASSKEGIESLRSRVDAAARNASLACA